VNPRLDVRGWRFGRLVALAFHSIRLTPNGTRRTMWLCECDCGALCVFGLHALRQGHHTTCGEVGCQRESRAAKKMRAWEARLDRSVKVDRLPSPTLDPERQLVRSAEHETLAAALDGLPARHRRVLELTFFDGLTTCEAATAMERIVETGGPPPGRWSLSRQRVDQLKAEALVKLRHSLRRAEERQEQVACSRWLLSSPLPAQSKRSAAANKKAQIEARRKAFAPRYYSVSIAARMLKLSEAEVCLLIQRGSIASVVANGERDFKRRLMPIDSVRAFIERRGA